MLDKMTYISSNGERIDFGANGIVINKSDFRNYEWAKTEVGGQVAAFVKKGSKKTLPVLIYGRRCKDIANAIHSIIERDVVNMTPGKLYIGNYYIEGYFYGSTKNSYLQTNILKFDLIFNANTGKWIYEKAYNFRYADNEESEFLDYPFDYSFDYFVGANAKYLVNDSVIPCDFKMVIYGGDNEDVDISIGGQIYRLYSADIADGEYVTIDSVARTIIKTDARGNTTNLFSTRSRVDDVFTKIKPGSNYVVWADNLNFDITIYQERSEPEWT